MLLCQFPLTFPSNSQHDALLHCKAYSRADWDGLCQHLKDVPWEDIFKLSASAAARFWLEPRRVQVGIDVYIPHRGYQVEPHSSPWFSATCVAAIVHGNPFFCLYQKHKSSDSKVKFRQASNHCKRVLQAAKLAYTTKQKSPLLPKNLAPVTFGKLLIVFSTKVNLLYLL